MNVTPAHIQPWWKMVSEQCINAESQGYLQMSMSYRGNSTGRWVYSIYWTQNHWKDLTQAHKPAKIFHRFLLTLLHPTFPLSLSLTLFLSRFEHSVHPSFLAFFSLWLTQSHSSRFIGSRGELGPLWRHTERYRVSSMLYVSLWTPYPPCCHRPRPPTMVARVLISVIMGGRAPSCVAAPLPLYHQPSIRWTYCYLFSLSWLCLSQLLHSCLRSIHCPQHHLAASPP